MTKIMFCACEHEYQDKKYGKNRRVHNASAGTAGKPAWTCTVCGTRKDK
jgi:hypothetical protein